MWHESILLGDWNEPKVIIMTVIANAQQLCKWYVSFLGKVQICMMSYSKNRISDIYPGYMLLNQYIMSVAYL
jgi:hypothetical protein